MMSNTPSEGAVPVAENTVDRHAKALGRCHALPAAHAGETSASVILAVGPFGSKGDADGPGSRLQDPGPARGHPKLLETQAPRRVRSPGRGTSTSGVTRSDSDQNSRSPTRYARGSPRARRASQRLRLFGARSLVRWRSGWARKCARLHSSVWASSSSRSRRSLGVRGQPMGDGAHGVAPSAPS